jgi:glycosyltransferase involved in cell wall biosynthesis
LRLAVVSPFLDRQHGTEVCVIEQIERLVRTGRCSIELYSQRVSQLNGVRPAALVLPGEQVDIRWHQVSDIPGPHLIKYLWWFGANYWQRRQDKRSGRVRPDIIYSPGINCPDADVIVVHIVFHAFYEQVRSELALHRLPFRSWPRVIHRRLYYKLVKSLERRIYSNRRVRLMAVSSLVARQLEIHFQREDVVVIPNAVDTLRFTSEARITKRVAARQSLSYQDSEFLLLLIGNDWKKKGLDALIEASALLKDLPLQILVVGADEPALYHLLIEKLGVQQRVRFEKPSMDVLTFYAAADLYVGPSLEDSFGLPILEAMACGVPVIASANAGASELVQDGKTGLILRDPRNQVELASLIRKIHGDDILRVSMGVAASRYVASNCNWDENAEKTWRVLKDSLNRTTA